MSVRSSCSIVVAAVTSAAIMTLFAACGGGGGKGEQAAASGATGESVKIQAASNKTAFSAKPVQLSVDPCSLVTRAEAERVIGASVSQGQGADGHICTYTANGNGGTVAVEEVRPEFCELLFVALQQNIFGGDQVRVDVGQGGMQVRGGGSVQFVVAGGCLEISASKGGQNVDDATMLALARTASERVLAAAGNPSPVTVTTASAGSDSAAGTPSRRPCDLLTKEIAEQALGVPVGDPTQGQGPGNETCNYRATDKSLTAMVYLTTYAAKGSEAALDKASAQFKNAYAVRGVGDAARVSIEEHAIGVLKGDVVFGIGMIPPSKGQQIAPVTEAQMVKLANAVLAGM